MVNLLNSESPELSQKSSTMGILKVSLPQGQLVLVLDFGVAEGQDAIRALVRRLLGVPSGCDTKKRADIANRAYKDGYLDSERQVYLNDLLNLPQPTELHTLYEAMDNEARNRGKQDTVVEFVRIASAKRPLLLAVEDIHWANKVTLEHLASISRTLNDCPALLVMTSRVDGDPIDLAWRGEAGNSPLASFDLGPLRESEALELAQGYVDTSSQFAKDCIARAEGNPFFLEQLLSSVPIWLKQDGLRMFLICSP